VNEFLNQDCVLVQDFESIFPGPVCIENLIRID